jgi:hypothetical protein
MREFITVRMALATIRTRKATNIFIDLDFRMRALWAHCAVVGVVLWVWVDMTYLTNTIVRRVAIGIVIGARFKEFHQIPARRRGGITVGHPRDILRYETDVRGASVHVVADRTIGNMVKFSR